MLRDDINNDLKQAMKAKNERRVSTLRLVNSALKNADIEARVYCGPVLRHPAELMLPAVDLGGRVWLGGRSCKGGPAAPAFGG